MPPALDLTNQRFGRLTAIENTRVRKSHYLIWRCVCDCGGTAFATTNKLRTNQTRSCGCLRSISKTKHGLAGTRAYETHLESKRRASKINRTPPWSEQEAIRKFYAECPAGYHVDYIVPLQGRNVSGLHVIDNLQYLPAMENMRKTNKFEPYYSA